MLPFKCLPLFTNVVGVQVYVQQTGWCTACAATLQASWLQLLATLVVVRYLFHERFHGKTNAIYIQQ